MPKYNAILMFSIINDISLNNAKGTIIVLLLLRVIRSYKYYIIKHTDQTYEYFLSGKYCQLLLQKKYRDRGC